MSKRMLWTIVCFILCLLLVVVCFCNEKTRTKGFVLENENNYRVDITITNNRLYGVLNRMSGDVEIFDENSTKIIEYKISGSVFGDNNCKWVTVHTFFDEGKYENGYMYFDKHMSNVVIKTSAIDIIASNESFLSKVEQLHNK